MTAPAEPTNGEVASDGGGQSSAPTKTYSFPQREGVAGKSRAGAGNSFAFNVDAFNSFAHAVLHSATVLSMLESKVNEMAETANSMAQIEGAEYKVTLVENWPDSSRARANVWTGNHKAMLDDAHNSTLLKTLAHYGGSATQ